jgi:hypothetical protein
VEEEEELSTSIFFGVPISKLGSSTNIPNKWICFVSTNPVKPQVSNSNQATKTSCHIVSIHQTWIFLRLNAVHHELLSL